MQTNDASKSYALYLAQCGVSLQLNCSSWHTTHIQYIYMYLHVYTYVMRSAKTLHMVKIEKNEFFISG